MRLLFVAMAESIHTARWLNQLEGTGWDLHLVAAGGASPHRELRNVTVYTSSWLRPPGLCSSVRVIGPGPLPRRLAYQALHRWPWPLPTGRLLSLLVRYLRPQLIHGMELRTGARLAARSHSYLFGLLPPLLVTSWGSELTLYGRIPRFRPELSAVLASANYFSAECGRDYALARELGLTGGCLPVLPGAGGLPLDEMDGLRQSGPSSRRRVIVLKGYQHFAGRALVGIEGLRRVAPLLTGYRVVVLQPCHDVALAAELLAAETGVELELRRDLPWREALRLHGRARLSIGLSIADGLSTSLLEAAAMGSLPIQSSSSCCDEVLSDGTGVLRVPAEDPELVANALRRGLTDDALVDGAALSNRAALERWNLKRVQPLVQNLYRQMAARERITLA